MDLIGRVHESFVHSRRVRVLSDSLADLIPRNSSVLDVGCGDGSLAGLIMKKRDDLSINGIDVQIRNNTCIPVDLFDGRAIPFEDADFDVVMFVDVLHHTADPIILLSEAARVARRAIVIKDHTANGVFAIPTLRFMDWVGNARHGIALPYNYWPRRKWLESFKLLGLTVKQWESELGIYAPPANWLFGRSLHFVALLDRS